MRVLIINQKLSLMLAKFGWDFAEAFSEPSLLSKKALFENFTGFRQGSRKVSANQYLVIYIDHQWPQFLADFPCVIFIVPPKARRFLFKLLLVERF